MNPEAIQKTETCNCKKCELSARQKNSFKIKKGKAQDSPDGLFSTYVTNKGLVSTIYKDSNYHSIRKSPKEKWTKKYEEGIPRERKNGQQVYEDTSSFVTIRKYKLRQDIFLTHYTGKNG